VGTPPAISRSASSSTIGDHMRPKPRPCSRLLPNMVRQYTALLASSVRVGTSIPPWNCKKAAFGRKRFAFSKKDLLIY
jgi:hypothetical protein